MQTNNWSSPRISFVNTGILNEVCKLNGVSFGPEIDREIHSPRLGRAAFGAMVLTMLGLAMMLAGCSEGGQRNARAEHPDFKADSVAMMSAFQRAIARPDSAEVLMETAAQLALKSPGHEEIHQLGLTRHFILTGQSDKAEDLARARLDAYADTDPNTNIRGHFLNLMAAVASQKGETESAVRYFEEAQRVFDATGNARQAAAVDFNLANIFFGRLDYVSAHRHAHRARQTFAALDNDQYEVLASGILAVTMAKLDSTGPARDLALATLDKSLSINAPQGIILANYALGECEQADRNYLRALDFYQEARLTSDSLNMLNLSLPVRAAQLDCYVKTGQDNLAIETGTAALSIAHAMNNIEIQYSLNRNLAFAHEQNGDAEAAFFHLKAADELFRKHTIDNNQRTIKEILAKYETEKKDHLLSINRTMILKQKVYIALLIAGIVLAFGLWFLYHRNAEQQANIKELNRARELDMALSQGEERERLRLSEELHDGIASSLTVLRLRLEGQADSEALQLVKTTHEEVRRIAHNLRPLDFEKTGWVSEVERFVHHLHREGLAVHFYANQTHAELPDSHALILYRAIQEVVQNALKHSASTSISIQVMSHAESVSISVEDNGIGFEVTDAETAANGLAHLRQRLAKVGATLLIDSHPGAGTSVFIQYKSPTTPRA